METYPEYLPDNEKLAAPVPPVVTNVPNVEVAPRVFTSVATGEIERVSLTTNVTGAIWVNP